MIPIFAPLLSSPAMQAEGTPPVISYPISGDVIEFYENDANAVLTVVASGSPFPSCALSGADAGLFELDGSELRFLSPPDFEDPQDADTDNVYELTVTATSTEGSFVVDLAVQVLNVVDVTPVITFPTDAIVQVPSGRKAAFSIRSLDDATDRNYLISGGADAGKFTVGLKTGRVSFIAAPDYATPTDADTDNDYQITVMAATLAGTDTQDVTVRVVEGGVRDNVSYPISSGIIKRLGRI